MDIISLQNSLKELYYSLGGNADNVRDTQDLNTIIDAISGLSIGSALKAALELPAAPEDDGTYHLQCVVDDGTAAYSWEADETPT